MTLLSEKRDVQDQLIHPANAQELASIARQIGAQVYPSPAGDWSLGQAKLSELLDAHRDQRLMLTLVPLGQADPELYTCGVCGFVVDELGECPRCHLMVADLAASLARRMEERQESALGT